MESKDNLLQTSNINLGQSKSVPQPTMIFTSLENEEHTLPKGNNKKRT